MKQSIAITRICWSVGSLDFADNTLSFGLKVKKTESNDPNFK
jgi:hypothetical protein